MTQKNPSVFLVVLNTDLIHTITQLALIFFLNIRDVYVCMLVD